MKMDTNPHLLSIARSLIEEVVKRHGYQVVRVLLFGSRSRNEAHPTSDWDFYVIISSQLSPKSRWRLADHICECLAERGIWADVFVQSEDIVEKRKRNTGYLTYYALKEGIEI